MAKQGIDTIREILERRDPPKTGSGFLDAVATIPFDRHDVKGCATLAREALAEVDADDPARKALGHIAEIECSNGRYAKRYMTGIFALCDEAVAAHDIAQDDEPSPGFAP